MLRFVLVYFRAFTENASGYTQHGRDIERAAIVCAAIGDAWVPAQKYAAPTPPSVMQSRTLRFCNINRASVSY
jgi:hypothetical protein